MGRFYNSDLFPGAVVGHVISEVIAIGAFNYDEQIIHLKFSSENFGEKWVG